MIDLSGPFGFYSGDRAMVPEFVSMNVHLELIVHDNLWSLQIYLFFLYF